MTEKNVLDLRNQQKMVKETRGVEGCRKGVRSFVALQPFGATKLIGASHWAFLQDEYGVSSFAKAPSADCIISQSHAEVTTRAICNWLQ